MTSTERILKAEQTMRVAVAAALAAGMDRVAVVTMCDRHAAEQVEDRRHAGDRGYLQARLRPARRPGGGL